MNKENNMVDIRGKARTFEVYGQDNRDGKHAGFLYRQEFLPMKDGLEFIRESIEKSDCEFFEVRIYDNDGAKKRAYEHSNMKEPLKVRIAQWFKARQMSRLYEKNAELTVKVVKKFGQEVMKPFAAKLNEDPYNLDSVPFLKAQAKELKAKLKEKKA